MTGQVVDLDGIPIAGAEVQSRTLYHANNRIGGSDKSVTPLTVTNSGGFFELAARDNIRAMDVRVIAAGYAAADKHWARGSNDEFRICLGRGATIRGRLLIENRPLAGVKVGLVQKNRLLGNLCTPHEISTDENGAFAFEYLPPGMDYAIYTHTGQQASGVLPVNLVAAPAHREEADLGEIHVQKPYRLSVMVRTEDDSRLPAKSYVYIGRDKAWRGTTLPLAQQPSVTVGIDDASRESFQVSVQTPEYEVVTTFPHLNRDSNGRYSVTVTGDIEITFVVREKTRSKPTQKAT